jgi:hypothetical protein
VGLNAKKCEPAREAMHADVASRRIVNTGTGNLCQGPLPFFEKEDISAHVGRAVIPSQLKVPRNPRSCNSRSSARPMIYFAAG